MAVAKLTESAIETLAIERLESQGFKYLHGSVIAFDGAAPERSSYSDVILVSRLRDAVAAINPHIPAAERDAAIKEVLRLRSPELLADNDAFHRLLTEGVPVSTHIDGDERGDRVWLVDFDNPLNNDFLVVNQFTIIENHANKRPDLILFVNGLPLVVIELKNAGDENATIRSAFNQIETYKATIPSLFTTNAFTVISDGLDAKAGSISAGYTRFMHWKSADGKTEASPLIGQLETLISGMLNPTTLLDLIRHFIVFEKGRREDPKTGQVSITTVKKLAAYHQYYAVNAAVESTLRAADLQTGRWEKEPGATQPIAETPESYGLSGVKSQPRGDRKAGVVWHTQGSGKSLSMVFYTGKIVLAMDNPTVLVITDRNDLDDQLFDTFASAKQLLRQEPVQADDRQQLKELLKVSAGGVVFSTIQKFQPEDGTALSKAFSIAVPHEQAMGAKDEVGFFQAVKARLVKFEPAGEGTSDIELETTIRQVIDEALVSDQVIDVFDAAGIKKPEISVLSDDFLAELKDHEHQNVALEVLRKLLNDELKSRAKKNLVQSKALLEMLETAIKRYQNKILTAAEVMEELIKVSKEIVASDSEAKSMGLTDFEYAFYTAVANNDSARELMQKDKLRELAVVLTQKVRENAAIDWTIKESVKSKLRVIVKRLLRHYGYPPDMQLLATETVLKQAEMIADELGSSTTR